MEFVKAAKRAGAAARGPTRETLRHLQMAGCYCSVLFTLLVSVSIFFGRNPLIPPSVPWLRVLDSFAHGCLFMASLLLLLGLQVQSHRLLHVWMLTADCFFLYTSILLLVPVYGWWQVVARVGRQIPEDLAAAFWQDVKQLLVMEIVMLGFIVAWLTVNRQWWTMKNKVAVKVFVIA